MQVIDGRDMATWMVELIENQRGGSFHAVSPEPPAAFSALQTTSPRSHRRISLGKTWVTIFRPGDPTTSPMNRIFKGMERPAAG